jgi:hypothetical protein
MSVITFDWTQISWISSPVGGSAHVYRLCALLLDPHSDFVLHQCVAAGAFPADGQQSVRLIRQRVQYRASSRPR